MGPHQQGLGVRVADAADAAVAVELGDILLKFGPEGGVLNIVDLALEAVLLIVYDHASPAGAQVGVVVHAEKDVEHAIPLGDCSEKSAQNRFLLSGCTNAAQGALLRLYAPNTRRIISS